MKYLTLIRHAKSISATSETADRDRTLTPRGHADAVKMAPGLRDMVPAPTIVLLSPAARVQLTANALADAGAPCGDRVRETHEELYLADVEVLWEFAYSALMESDEAWLLAHNPGITEAIEFLTGSRIENVPTLGVARIGFEEVLPEGQNGRLLFFDCPKNHRGEPAR